MSAGSVAWLSRASDIGNDGPPVRRCLRRGVLGAVLVLLAFGMCDVFAVRPFYAGDETAHTNYALEVSHGRLPTFTDQFAPRIPGMDVTPTWTAVHGPLYYLIAGWPLRLGIASGHPVAGLRATRILTLLLSAAAVVIVGRLTAALLPGRPRRAIATAGLLALITSYQQASATVYNDALAVLATAFTLLLIVVAIRQGCSLRLAGALALGAAACAATRASGLEVAALAALAAASAPPGERGRSRRNRLVPAVGRMALVSSAVIITSGWFYARNLRLYRDIAGSAQATQGRPAGPSPLHNALSARFWLDQYRQLWGSMTGGDRIQGWVAAAAYVLLAAVLIGLALAVVRWIRQGARLPRGRAGLAGLAMAAHAALVIATVLSYFHRGAIPFGRYFFPALPLLPIVATAGLAALPGARRGLSTFIGLLIATGIGVAMTGVVIATMNRRAGANSASLRGDLIGRLIRALAAASVPAPGLALLSLAALLAAGLWLLMRAVAQLPPDGVTQQLTDTASSASPSGLRLTAAAAATTGSTSCSGTADLRAADPHRSVRLS